jgi:cytochrome P450
METFRDIMTRRRSGKESPQDFLQSMIQRDSYLPNEKLDDTEIMDNLLTLIVAGQTTTAAAMMWSVKFLDENKEAQDRLRVSVMQILNQYVQPTYNLYLVFKNSQTRISSIIFPIL